MALLLKVKFEQGKKLLTTLKFVSFLQHLYDFTRGHIIGKLGKEQQTIEVSIEFGIVQIVVWRLW